MRCWRHLRAVPMYVSLTATVIAGAVNVVYFWRGATGLTSAPSPSPAWTYTIGTDSKPVMDVAIDDAGDYMAACSGIGVPLTVYFFGQAGDLKWSWGVNADKLSISSNGATLAVGTPIATTGFLLSTGFQTPTPVGGFMEPVNKLAVFAPYLALLGVIGAVAVIYWKRPDN